MNWDKAKTMLILFLLGLNVFLVAMHFVYEDDYAVSREDIQVITTILAQHDITLDTTNVEIPRSFPPVDQLTLNPAVYSTSQLVGTFFTDTANISQTIEFGNPIFSSQEGTLIIMRHIVQFRPSPYSQNPIFSTTTYNLQAETSFAQFLQANADLFPGFEFDQTTTSTDNETVIVEFRQNYSGYTILSNVLRFTVTPNGVTEISYIYYPPGEFAGVRQSIISPTQALFMFKLGNAHIGEPIAITRIDLVHNIAFAEDGFERITTVPYYRIFHSHGEPMLINAITGDIE